VASDITYALFVARFPGFATEDSDRQTEIQYALDDAELSVHRATWDDLADRAVMLLAAHELTESGRTDNHGGGGAGAVTARTVGPGVVGYGDPKQGKLSDDYRTTSYGVKYLRLRNQLVLTPLGSS